MGDIFAETMLNASFEGVEFHVEAEDGEFGHDAVEHTAYRRDGADLEPTGWRALRGAMTALFFNDIEAGLWPGRYRELVETIRRTPIGRLIHPVEGVLTALVKTGHRTTDARARNGVRLRLEWVEHNASAGEQIDFRGATTTDAPAAVAQQASEADTAMAVAAPGGGFATTLATINAQLDRLESTVRTVAEIEAALRTMTRAVDANLTSSAFAGTSGHAAVVALVALRGSIVRLRSRYLPDASRLGRYVVPTLMPIWAVALAVYGDAREAPRVLAANAVPDPLFIAPGTVLTILPND